MRLAAWILWPLGAVLVTVQGLGGLLPAPVFLLLDTAYAVGALLFVRALGGRRDPQAAALVLAGPGIFVLAGLTGIPTAAAPASMLLNAVVLLAAAVVLLVVAVRLAVRVLGPAAVLGALAFVVGSTVYLVNLVARWAVVASGAAPLQAVAEERYWQAHSYLPWLSGEPPQLGVALVLLDLLQLVYVVLTYLGTAGLARALGAPAIERAGWTLAGVTLLAAVVAPALPVAGGIAFGLSIPFMSTALPYALGIVMIIRNGDAGAPAPQYVRPSWTSRRPTTS